MPAVRLPIPNFYRTLALTVLILLTAEGVIRNVTLYPWRDNQRFNYTGNNNGGFGVAGRQLEEAVDHVRENARTGDWILLGDSILAGARLPSAITPATALREKLRAAGTERRVWDLTLVSSVPAVNAAILGRLGPLPGVRVLTNVSQKLMSMHNFDQLYFVQLWDHLENWPTTSEPLRQIFRELKEARYADYEKSEPKGYGQNLSELKVSVWANTHIQLLTLDHWLRFHFTTKPWSSLGSAVLLEGFQPSGAKLLDLADREPTPSTYADQDAAYLSHWYGRSMNISEPMWRGYLIYLEMLGARKQDSIVSLHTISLPRARALTESAKGVIEGAYSQVRGQAASTPVTLIEPNEYILENEYTDEDHFGAAGIQRWMDDVLAKAGT